MPFTVGQVKDHLIGMGHGGTLNKVRNVEAMFERSAMRFLLKMHPVDVMRTTALIDLVHDDLNDYDLPDDFGGLIDIFPQEERQKWDDAYRDNAGRFDLLKAVNNRVVSIESVEGVKTIRINWKKRSPKVLHTMDSLTSNGTWSAVAGASGLIADKIIKKKGSASIRFDVVATGDGIQNTAMSKVDMTDEDEVADVLFDIYIKNAADRTNFTSITARWGIDLTANFWVGVAQTLRADGAAFRVGWNPIKVPWSTATETGTVTPKDVDSMRFTVTIGAAINDLRIDNVRFSIGRSFDIKYYSKYVIKNAGGTWISRFTTDDDTVVLDSDSLPHYLMELLIDMAQQMEGTDSAFDITFAENQLKTLYPAYRGVYPSQMKKVAGRYGASPSRGRW